MEFRVWLEQGDVEQAILSTVGGDDISLDDVAAERILNINTKDLMPRQLDQLLSLGVLTNIADDDPQRYNSIIALIKQGVSIKDLIEKVAGKDQFPIRTKPNGKHQLGNLGYF